MTKVKKSFFEKLTGAKRVNEDNAFQREKENQFQSITNIYAEDEQAEMLVSNNEESSVSKNLNSSVPQEDGEGQLTIDVYQNDNEIIIKSTIAGVKPEDLDVSINNDMITIRGERKQEEEISEENYYYQECYWGNFSRSVILPVDVIADKIEASMKNGILTIKMPKADNTKAKKIQVRGF